jgi:hypothetical protein
VNCVSRQLDRELLLNADELDTQLPEEEIKRKITNQMTLFQKIILFI